MNIGMVALLRGDLGFRLVLSDGDAGVTLMCITKGFYSPIRLLKILSAE